MAGDLDSYHAMVAKMRAASSTSRFVIESLELRVGGWFGDTDAIRRCRPSAVVAPDHPLFRFFEAQRSCLLGEGDADDLLDSLKVVLTTGSGPRLDAYMRQLAIEALVPMGALDRALAQLRIAADTPAFVDTDWMERCPALEPLRADPAMAALISQVRRRADAIWRVRAS